MDAGSVTDYVLAHIPEIILLIGGMAALLVVYTYVKNESSMKYKFMMVLGLVFGALMIALSVSSYTNWERFPAALIILTGFALVIRPFREVHFALIGALLIMALAYLFLGDLAGTQLEVLAEGWPRIIAAFILGAVAYMIMNFVEAIVKLIGKLLNWWPLLLVLAIVCIIESVLMFSGYGSLYDFVTGSQ
ncbi:MAG: hypothetical protein LBR42_03685 [Candidatus Methanoplasma sp.]|jgi:peptidoglycan/LPS O-acetylase OafA/YrhL|nr:hypothetical protein [Candidatus Methanoplasma sp.]